MLKKKFQSEGKKKEDDAWLDAEECRLVFKFRTGDGAKLSRNTSFYGFGLKSQTSEQAKTDSKTDDSARVPVPEIGAFQNKKRGLLRTFKKGKDASFTVVCNGVSCSPDGELLAAGYSNGNNALVVFQAYKKERVNVEGETKFIAPVVFSIPKGSESGDADIGRLVCFSPCGAWLVVAGKGKSDVHTKKESDKDGNEVATEVKVVTSSLLVYDARNLKEDSKPIVDLSEKSITSIKCLAFSNDGKYLAISTNSHDKGNVVSMYLVNSTKQEIVKGFSYGPQNLPAESSGFPSDTVLFSKSTQVIFDANSTGTDTSQIRGITWSPDDRNLAIGVSSKSVSATIYVLSMTGYTTQIRSIKFRHREILDLKWSKTGKWIAAVGEVDTDNSSMDHALERGGIQIIDTQMMMPVFWIKQKVQKVTCIEWGPDDKRLIAGDSEMKATIYASRTWAYVDSVSLGSSSENVTCVALNCHRDIIVSGGLQNPVFMFRYNAWEVSDEHNMLPTEDNEHVDGYEDSHDHHHIRYYRGVAWSPDGRLCALTYGNSILVEQATSVDEAKKGDTVAEVEAPYHGNLGSIAWSPDGHYIAVGYREGVSKVKQAYIQAVDTYKKKKALWAIKVKHAKNDSSRQPSSPARTSSSAEKSSAGSVELTDLSPEVEPTDDEIDEETMKVINNMTEEPVPPEAPSPGEPHTYYVIVYDAYKIKEGILIPVFQIPSQETITSVSWGPKSKKLIVTSCDIVPNDKIQAGSCRVYEKQVGSDKAVKWKSVTPEEFPFLAPSKDALKVKVQTFLDALCLANSFDHVKIKNAQVQSKGWGRRQPSTPSGTQSDSSPQQIALSLFCTSLKDNIDKQTRLYEEFTNFISKISNSYVKEASALAKTINIQDPDSIPDALTKAISQLYPLCQVAAMSPDGTRLAIGLSRECLIINTNTWRPVAKVGRVQDESALSKTEENHNNYVSAIDWNADGSKIAIATWSANISIYDSTKSYKLDRTLESTKQCHGMSWSNDDEFLVGIFTTESDGDFVYAFDLQTMTRAQRWQSHNGSVGGEYTPQHIADVAWSPDGNSNLAVTGIVKKESIDGNGKAKQLTYFSVWQRGYSFNPQLIPLRLDPDKLIKLLENNLATLYLSDEHDTLLQCLLEQRKMSHFRMILSKFPLAAGSVKIIKKPNGDSEVLTVFDVAIKRRDENAIIDLLGAASREDVAGTSLPIVASNAIPSIIAAGFENVVVDALANLPFHNSGSPVKQARLEETLYKSNFSNIDQSYNDGRSMPRGGLWGSEYNRLGMSVQAKHTALPNLGSSKILTSLVHANSSILDNDTMRAVLDVMWEKHVKKFFLAKAAIFVVMCALWVALVQMVMVAQSTGGAVARDIRIVYISTLAINFYFLGEEYKQAIGNPLGVVSHFKDVWNCVDLFSFLSILGFIFTLESGSKDNGDAYIFVGVASTIVLMLRSLSYLRGFESTGWLITVLVQNIIDVKPFLIVMSVIILGSSVAFRLLLGKVENGEFCDSNFDGGGSGVSDLTREDDCVDHPYGSTWISFFSVFLMTVLGDFDTDLFQQSASTIVTQLVFLFVVLFITVISLNALIALLGDSYAKVSENEAANKSKERAELICEFLGIMRKSRRDKIERESRYIHLLQVSKTAKDERTNTELLVEGLKDEVKELKIELANILKYLQQKE